MPLCFASHFFNDCDHNYRLVLADSYKRKVNVEVRGL